MLKHITNPAGPANGQLRSSSSNNNNNNIVPQRSIHLRPQQPLNISTLSTATSTANSTATGACPITLLTINAPCATTLRTANNANKSKGTPISLLTELTDNNPLNHNGQHTYTNQQHIYTNHTDSSGFSPVKTQSMNNQQNSTHNHNNSTMQPNYSNFNNLTGVFINQSKHGPRPQEALTSLGLLCLVSLLFALLSLIFLLKISPNERENAIMRSSTEDFVIVYDVTLALCTLSLSLNLCCLLVCAIQFLFAVKLVRSPLMDSNKNKYLEKSRVSRCCAIGGFFISIPIFLTGIILYTFNHFHSTPAIITSVLIGIGIVFCGAAMVHNVFVWQKEKTLCYKSASINNLHTSSGAAPQIQQVVAAAPQSPSNNNNNSNGIYLIRPSTATPPTPKPIANGCLQMSACEHSDSVSPGISPVLDLSHMSTLTPHELSTLV